MRLTFDLETSGKESWQPLTPWHEDGKVHIVSWQEDNEDVQAIRLHSDQDLIEWCERVFARADIVVGWNLMFDTAWLMSVLTRNGVYDKYWRDEFMYKRYIDGLLLWQRTTGMYFTFARDELHIRKSENSYSLKNWAKQHGRMYKTIDFNSLDYAKEDVINTVRAVRTEWSNLSVNQRVGFDQECSTIPVLAEQWVRGVKVDVDSLKTLGKTASKAMVRCAKAIGIDKEHLNSDAKLRTLLYETWGLRVPLQPNGTEHRTKSGKESVDSYALKVLGRDHKKCKAIAEYRKNRTKKAKFYDAVVKALKFNGKAKVYVPHRISSTYTARITVASKTKATDAKGIRREYPTGIALHQWQQDPMVRDLLVPPDGYSLVEFDASGQEMRLMTDHSGDPVMMDIFNKNLKGHAVMASQIYHEPYEVIMARRNSDPEYAKKYKVGKLANLSLQYRTGWNKLGMAALDKNDLDLEVEDLKSISRTYKNTYKMVPEYWRDAIDRGKANGYALARDGRMLQLGEWDGEDWRRESSSINYPIQSTGAAIKYYAIKSLIPLMLRLDAYFAWDLHDGLFYYVPDANVLEFCKEAQSTLDNLDYSVWGWEPRVPMLWEGAYGKRWSEMKEYESSE